MKNASIDGNQVQINETYLDMMEKNLNLMKQTPIQWKQNST
jgi:hypothetical protein